MTRLVQRFLGWLFAAPFYSGETAADLWRQERSL